MGLRNEETIVQVHIDGPLQITFVNRDNDPGLKINEQANSRLAKAGTI